MRIGYFVGEFAPEIRGELGEYATNMVLKFIELGHDVSVFTMNDGTLKTREIFKGIDVNRPLPVEGSNVLPLFFTEDFRRWDEQTRKFFNDIFVYNVLSASKFVNDLIKKEGLRFDIICAHDWLSAIAGIMVKQETGLPFVFHVHSTEWGRTMNTGLRVITQLEGIAGTIADRIITVSYPMMEDLYMHGWNAEKISVCWNGINPEIYDPKRIDNEEIQNLRKKYDVSNDKAMILFNGRLTAIKGVTNLLKAMPIVLDRNPNIKLIILGSGELEMAVIELIRSLGIENDVIANFKFIPEDEKILHYASCNIAVFPSLYEPFGIGALEAMSMEKPVVVGVRGVSGFKDFVIPSGHYQTGIHVDGNNSADIARGINTLLEDIEEAREMGKRGRMRVKKYFTWDKLAEYTISIYEDVIKEIEKK